MSTNRASRKLVLRVILAFACFGATAFAQQAKRPFTVADDIGLTLFEVQGGSSPELHFSPDGKYFAVWTERGRLGMKRVEDSLRFYRTRDVHTFLYKRATVPPAPAWLLRLSGKQYPVIDKWRWLGDSSGVAFLKAEDLKQQLMLADLRTKTVKPLTSPAVEVSAFDIQDQRHFIYVIHDHSAWLKKKDSEEKAGAFVATGVDLWSLQFPDHPLIRRRAPAIKQLWAVIDGQRFEVKRNGIRPVFDELAMALSPDGKSLATVASAGEVPPSWGALYPPPPFLSYGGQHPIQAGHGTANQFVRIDLKSGLVQPLVDAPSMDSVGIVGMAAPAWSSDGHKVLLPGTFLKSRGDAPRQPCIAIVDLSSSNSSCVVTLKEGYNRDTGPVDNYHRHFDLIVDAHFDPQEKRRVLVNFDTADGTPGRTMTYQQGTDLSWQAVGETIGTAEQGPGSLEIRIKETFQKPPLLVASNKDLSAVLWNPNPQLKNIQFVEPSVYKWKDANGRQWEGGLYKPVNYQAGHHYPLVIQSHGFVRSAFFPSGLMSTAFAAQELAAAGIIVLQSAYGDQDCEMSTIKEAPCEVGLMDAAARQLVSEGLVDPENIGIVGFSRTCYYVMQMLTTNSLHLKAASITDGVMADYYDYVSKSGDQDAEKLIGARPFGEGLQEWFRRSPSFNLDKVNTPLLVNGLYGRAGVMWSPYAELHALGKPVELMVVNANEHILTNPAARMASQGGSVDWFRFWLQGYEDPDPAKAEQYKRWRGMRQMQEESEKQSAARADNN